MDNSSSFGSLSKEKIRTLMQSSEAKQLLEILNRDGGERLRKAKTAFEAGNSSEAQNILSPLMKSPQAASLIQKLNRKKD